MKISTPYEMIGGEQILLNLVDQFYFYMDTLPEAQGIRALHQHNLAFAKDKLFKFLSGWVDPICSSKNLVTRCCVLAICRF
jgi:hemoglobin